MRSIVQTAKSIDEAVNQALVELNCSLDDVNIEILEEPRSGLFGLIGGRDAVVRVSLKDDFDPEDTIWDENETATFEEDLEKAETPEQCSEEYVEIEKTEETVAVPEEVTEEQPAEAKAEVEAEEKTEETAEESAQESEPEASPEAEEAFVGEDDEDFEEAADEAVSENRELIPAETAAKDWLTSVLEDMHIEATVRVSRDKEYLRVEIIDINDVDMGIVIGRRAETLNALQYLLSIAVNRLSGDRTRVFLDVGGYRGRRKASIERMAKRNADKVARYGRPIALEPMNAYERRIVHFALQNVDGVTTVSEGREPYRKVVIKVDR